MPDREHQKPSQNPNTSSKEPDRNKSTAGLQSARRENARGQVGRPYSSPWLSGVSGSPFDLMRRFNEEVDRWFGGGFGFGASQPWSPNVEVRQRGNELLIRADLPGLDKDDVEVEVSDDAVTIRGERRQEHEEEHEGYYRSERSYGSFHRTIPLPEGTIADSAKANFKNGVLEITVQAPPTSVSRGRRIEIGDAQAEQKPQSTQQTPSSRNER